MRHGHPLLVDTFSQYGVGMFYALAGAFHAVPLDLRRPAAHPLRRLRGRVRARVRRPAPRLPLAAGRRPRAGGGDRREPRRAAPVHRVSEHRAAPLRLAVGGDPRRDAASAIDGASAAPRRGDAAHRRRSPRSGAPRPSSTRLAAYAAITVVLVVDGAESRERAQPAASPSASPPRSSPRSWRSARRARCPARRRRRLAPLDGLPEPRGALRDARIRLAADPGVVARLSGRRALRPLADGPARAPACECDGDRSDGRRHGRAPPPSAPIAFTYFLGRSAPSNLHHVAVPAVVVICGWWTIAAPQLRALGRAYAWAAVLAASCVGASVIASSSNATGRWLGGYAARAGRCARPTRDGHERRAASVDADEPDPRVVEGARLARRVLDLGPTAGRPHPRRAVSRRCSSRRAAGNALPIVNGNQDGLIDEPALKRVAAATDRLPEGTIVLTETTFMRRPPESFAQLDPIANRLRFGDYFVARSYAALWPSGSTSGACGAGRFGYVVLESGGTDERPRLHRAEDAVDARRLQGRPRVRAGDPPHRPRAVHAGGRRPHRLGALRRGHRRGALRGRPRRRATRATPTATASSSRRATRASPSTRRSTSATG